MQSRPRLDLAPPPELSATTYWNTRRVLAVYSPSHKFANDLLITSTRAVEFSRSTAGISVMKYVTGKGDVKGGVRIELHNRLGTPVHLVLLDSAPWYAEIYFSSLSVTRQDRNYITPITFPAGKPTFCHIYMTFET